MNAAPYENAADAASTMLSVAIARANRRVSIDAVERGPDGLPPSFGAVLVANAVLLGACWLREGLSEVVSAIEASSDDATTVQETGFSNLEEKLAELSCVIGADNCLVVEALRGIEHALHQRPPQPPKGKPCRRGT